MQYNESPNPAAPAEVQEPATAYATIPVWSDTDNNTDDIDWDAIGAPESVTVHSYEELCQKLEAGMADIEAGRVYSWEEVRRELRREFFNESI
jgi:hypothetical protein